MWRYLCYAVGFIFGSVMLFGGAFVLHSMPDLFADKIKSQLPILNGTEAYRRYTESNIPLNVKWYFFNVTNPREVIKLGHKPNLEQVGPYTFTERRRKEVLRISSDNTTLDYRLFRSYYFNQHESPSLDIELTLPNAPAFTAFFAAEEKQREEESAANPMTVVRDYVGNETAYLTHKASDWILNGIELKWLDELNDDGVVLDNQPPNNRFGFLYLKNNTWDEDADGTMTIFTGADGDMKNIGRVVKWNGRSDLSFWRGKSCNTLKGTDGQFFHPFIQKDEKLEIFAPDLCRTLEIEFIKTTNIRSIELYRFGISDSFFRPTDYNDDTKCYCVKRAYDKHKFCKRRGIVDLSSCRKKPIVLSTPHFYNGDPQLGEAVRGLAPSAANHDTFVDIEPMTGAVLQVRRRLQINVDLNFYEGFRESTIFHTRLIHPLIWLDQSITIPDDLAQKLENKLRRRLGWLKYFAMLDL